MLASKDGISVPICVSGLVSKIEVDICMDGAKYRVTSTIGEHRVKPRNGEVDAVLARVAGSRTNCGVCGYMTWGPECAYLDAYWAGLPERLNELADALEMEGARS